MQTHLIYSQKNVLHPLAWPQEGSMACKEIPFQLTNVSCISAYDTFYNDIVQLKQNNAQSLLR